MVAVAQTGAELAVLVVFGGQKFLQEVVGDDVDGTPVSTALGIDDHPALEDAPDLKALAGSRSLGVRGASSPEVILADGATRASGRPVESSVPSGSAMTITARRRTSSRVIATKRCCCQRARGSGCRRITWRGS
jgi:hypothetical protein